MAAYWAFAGYAAIVLLVASGDDVVWAAWAVPAYGVAAVMLPRSRAWGIALLTAVFAVGAPLLLMLAQGDLAAGMAVIERSATLLVRDGTPYLPAHQLSSWLAYDPYLPAMALFGLPSALGLQGTPGDPRVWLVLATIAALAAALRVLLPHPVRSCTECRRHLLRATAFAVACPVLALNLVVTTTDPPVLALMLLALSLISYPERVVPAAAALGLACAMKPTAWLAIPVLAAMLRARDGTRPAAVFTGTTFAFVVAATAPAVIASPVAMVQNTVLFPLGLTTHLTPAQSLTPGDLLARLGPAGHAVAVALLLTAGLAVAVSLVVRPPCNLRAATWRLAIGLALMFALGPAERFGYFSYPLALAGWLLLTRQRSLASPGPTPPRHRRPAFPALSTVKSVILNVRRRLFLRSTLASAAAVAVAGAAGVELISRGVLPGKGELDELDGACMVDSPGLATYARPGPQLSGTFYSAARRQAVGYTIAYPPGHGPGSELPLVVMLHGYGAGHATALSGMSPAQAVALRVDGVPLPPMALVTADGGDGYWNPHQGDDPLGMLTGELIPLCQRRGLGRAPHRIGVMGISMGGFGALLLAEKRPDLVAAVAAISPAIWTSYDQARAANAGAYASAGDFAADDAVTHAAALTRVPVRVAAGRDDPFYPGVQALARALPKGAVVDLTSGCHDGSFFTAQEPPSLAFLGRHLAG